MARRLGAELTSDGTSEAIGAEVKMTCRMGPVCDERR
jgi:hypothetical protein